MVSLDRWRLDRFFLVFLDVGVVVDKEDGSSGNSSPPLLLRALRRARWVVVCGFDLNILISTAARDRCK